MTDNAGSAGLGMGGADRRGLAARSSTGPELPAES
jgi:hypothetical protein